MSQSTGRTPHDVIASRVKDLRKRRGWSAKHLADELQAVGVPWDRSIVANFETRRRVTVSVEELLALAYVFSVAPLHLMVPIVGDGTPEDEYEVVPGVAESFATVRAWIRGQTEPFGDPRVYVAEMPEHERQPDRHGLIPSAVTEAALAERGVKRISSSRRKGK